MNNRSVLNSPRLLELKKKRNKILRKKIYFSVIVFLIFAICLSFLFKWQKINISNIEITGNRVLETKMIEDVVQENMTGNYLWFFPKTNFLIYPKSKIKTELTDKFKRIKDLSLSVKNFNTLDVTLAERKGLYTYCGNAPDLQNQLSVNIEKCYFLDEDGYVFDEAPYFSGEVYVKFYGKTNINRDLTTEESDPSGIYFFQPNFKKLIALKDTLEKIGLKPVVFYAKENGDIGMYLSSQGLLQLGPEIIFKIDSDPDQIVENLQSVLTTEPLQTDFKSKYSSLLYIDLRFGNKVYYKFR